MITIPKNGKDEIRVSIEAFKGQSYLNIRTWFPGDDGTMRPGKGIAMRAELAPQVIDAIKAEIDAGGTA